MILKSMLLNIIEIYCCAWKWNNDLEYTIRKYHAFRYILFFLREVVLITNNLEKEMILKSMLLNIIERYCCAWNDVIQGVSEHVCQICRSL